MLLDQPTARARRRPGTRGHGRDAGAIAAALADRIEPLCRDLLVGGRRVGSEWECGDLTGAPGRSLKVCLRGEKAGVWSDFADGIGGDALDLVAASRRCTKAEALHWARHWLGRAPAASLPVTAPRLSQTCGSASERHRRLAQRLWDEARPIAGSPVATYLNERGLALETSPLDLRFDPNCRHPAGDRWPAMIAAVRNATGALVAVHRTFLDPTGIWRAPVTPDRAALGPIRGAAVHLGNVEDDAVVAEGIESALAGSLLMDGAPAWATLGAGGLRNLTLPPLPVAAHVMIFVDGDAAGEKAARAAALRWRGEARHVWMLRAPAACDSNDILKLPELRERVGSGNASAAAAIGAEC